MYYVEDGTKKAGFYECKKCFDRFLAYETDKRTFCPNCSNHIDYEIGPDETLEDILMCAELIDVIEGEENVAKMDKLLSCAFDDDDSWI